MTRRKGASDLFPIHLHFWTALDSSNEVLQFYRQSRDVGTRIQAQGSRCYRYRWKGETDIFRGDCRFGCRLVSLRFDWDDWVLNLCLARMSWPMRCSRIGKHVEFDTNGESLVVAVCSFPWFLHTFHLISALDLPTFIYTISVHHYPLVPPLRCHPHWRRRAA